MSNKAYEDRVTADAMKKLMKGMSPSEKMAFIEGMEAAGAMMITASKVLGEALVRDLVTSLKGVGDA